MIGVEEYRGRASSLVVLAGLARRTYSYDSSWLLLSCYLHQAELRLASVRTARCLVSSKQQVQPQRCNALSLSQSRAGVWGPGCGNLSVFPALG